MTPLLVEAPPAIPTLEELTRGFSIQWHIRQAFPNLAAVMDRKPVKSNGYKAIARVNTWE